MRQTQQCSLKTVEIVIEKICVSASLQYIIKNESISIKQKNKLPVLSEQKAEKILIFFFSSIEYKIK